MNKINWTVRFRNKNFWLAVIPATLLLLQVCLVPFGYKFEISDINNQLLDIVNAAFAVMAIIGIVNDPTTDKLSDSNKALTYEEPRK